MIAYAKTFHKRPIDVGGKQSDTSMLNRMNPYKNKEMWYDC